MLFIILENYSQRSIVAFKGQANISIPLNLMGLDLFIAQKHENV